MNSATIEARYFILSGTTKNGRLVVEKHGKYWHVVEEKLLIPRLNRSGYVLKAEDGFFLLLRKHGSEHFKVENEFFKEVEIFLDCEADIQGDDNSSSLQESGESGE